MVRHVVPDVVGGQDLLTMPGTATVTEAAVRMTDRHVRCVLVTEEDRLTGIFTVMDLLRRVVAPGLRPEETPLHKVMSPDPVTIEADARAIEALRCMDEHGFRHLPVMRQGKLAAILSRRDFSLEEEEEIDLETRIWEHI